MSSLSIALGVAVVLCCHGPVELDALALSPLLASALQAGVGGGGEDGVTLAVTVTEEDVPSIPVRIAHLQTFQHYTFHSRIYVVDTHGSPPSLALEAAMQRTIQEGLMDSWVLVDYSPESVASVRERAGWTSDFVVAPMPGAGWTSDFVVAPMPGAGRHVGNLVYYFMLDVCKTRFLVHFDLDIVGWARPGFSWVEEAVGFLRSSPFALEVQPPLPGMHPSGERLMQDRTCRDRTFITSRYYAMDVIRYRSLLSSVREAYKDCTGDVHWEDMVSCATCRSQFRAYDLTDSNSAWVLHFPVSPEHRQELPVVLSDLVEQGVAVPDPSAAYNAAPLEQWLANLERRRLPAVIPGWSRT